MKAPNPTLNFNSSARSASPKQNPRTDIIRVSSLLKRATKFISRGTTSNPSTMTATRKMARRPAMARIPVILTSPEVATPERQAIIRMAMISSAIRMPKMTSANLLWVLRCSASVFAMIVVEEIIMIAPR